MHAVKPRVTHGQTPHREATLLARIADGDTGAFEELFDRCSGMVLALLLPLLGRRETAEEVLQETFLQVWREAGRYRSRRASARGWLTVLARSRARDRLRSSRARAVREEAVVRLGVLALAEEPGAGESLEVRDRRRLLTAALAAISPEQRQAVELAFFAGLSQRQVAGRLGLPLGTAKSRILLGLKKMRRALDDAQLTARRRPRSPLRTPAVAGSR